jgi:hypothetical protein
VHLLLQPDLRLHPHLLLHPHLPLQVSAVILNAVKDPEEFHPPQPPASFQPILSRRNCCCFTVAIASSPTQKHVISKAGSFTNHSGSMELPAL